MKIVRIVQPLGSASNIVVALVSAALTMRVMTVLSRGEEDDSLEISSNDIIEDEQI